MRCSLTDEFAVFTAALERTGSDRSRFLDGACGSDHAFRARIEAYLKAHQDEQGPLDAPPPGMTATIQNRKPTDRIGETIGSYTLRELLGEGGMGAVYVAEQEQPVRRKVALKVIKPGMDSREIISRFESERQALAMMDHANIAKVFDAGTAADGRPYFVMELVKGIPITERCDENQMDVKQRLALFIQVCHAVQHAHQKGVIHRDLKPSNVLVTMQDVTPAVKVIDFGVAKAMGGALTENTVYTGFNQMIGTPLYMSPEQAGLSGLDADTRSDIYSLGVLLYELLTGATPFGSQQLRDAGYDELRRIIREDDPPRPSARLSTLEAQSLSTVCDRRKVEPQRLVQQMRGELDWIVMKALEKDRASRDESASAFALDVQRYLNGEMVEAYPPSFVYRTRKFVARHKWPVVTSASLVLLLVLGVFGTSIGFVTAMREEKRAKEEAAVAQAVKEFLQEDLLRQADPDRNPRDRQVTVEELLDRAAHRIDGRFGKQPRVEAAIRLAIGNSYLTLGNFSSAQPHLKRALQLYQQTLGDHHPETLESANDLAGVYVEQGQYERAEPILVRTLERRRRVLGAEHPDTLFSMNNLAGLYVIQGNYAKAEPHCLLALNSLAAGAG